MPFAILILSLSLYPYVYLITRAAFLEQSARTGEVARTLGASPFRRFVALGVPMARPAIAIGVTVVAMEVMNDLGTVATFAIPTLTTGIFSLWLDGRNLAGAAQLACLTLALIMILVMFEAYNRRRMRFWQSGKAARTLVPATPKTGQALAMTAACLVPVLLGFECRLGFLQTWPLVISANGLIPAWQSPAAQCGGRGHCRILCRRCSAVHRLAGPLAANWPVGNLLPLVTAGYGIPARCLRWAADSDFGTRQLALLI